MGTPYGVILMWDSTISGSVIPNGWQICDGTNSTPDLRAYFVRGASNDSEVNTNGGLSSHNHTSPQLVSGGSHSHSVSGGTGNNSSTQAGTGTSGTVSAIGTHSHNWSGTSSSGEAHTHSVGDSQSSSIVPPYYKLYYIMEIL